MTGPVESGLRRPSYAEFRFTRESTHSKVQRIPAPRPLRRARTLGLGLLLGVEPGAADVARPIFDDPGANCAGVINRKVKSRDQGVSLVRCFGRLVLGRLAVGDF